MGQPGSGKGTQGEMLAHKLGYDYFSTGQYLRNYMTEKRKQEILVGKLIDDSEMIEIIKTFLSQTKDQNRTILDGFPRTLRQANWLMNNQKKLKIKIEGIIFLDVGEEALIKRLLARARPDDTLQAIKQRFREYTASTAPVIEYFRKQKIKVYAIDGDKSMEQVQQDISEQIGLANRE
ncbi:nucleoside monophosphate kinase [Candidatus Parcubacteria bacterium]|nr:nucleoside monophosphate kinase [Candidatus Parcubacteria bacterium]